MSEATARRHRTLSILVIVACLCAIPIGILAQAPQGRGGGRGGQGAGAAPAGAPAAPGAPAGGPAAAAPAGQGRGGNAGAGAAAGAGARGAAPVDLTGYWVSLVTEDWIERMAPNSPPSGAIRGGGGGGRGGGGGGLQAGGAPPEPCRVYGAGGSLRVPGRLNISWADDNTLKIEMDAGTQTRLLRFGAPAQAPGGEKTLQGYSVAAWETGGGGRGGGRGAGPAAGGARWGNLRVVTTNMRAGYLLTSRSVYSENAVLTEHFTRHSEFGNDYFTVTATVEDGGNLRVTSSTFKKEPNGSKFSPSGCEITK